MSTVKNLLTRLILTVSHIGFHGYSLDGGLCISIYMHIWVKVLGAGRMENQRHSTIERNGNRKMLRIPVLFHCLGPRFTVQGLGIST